MQCFDSNAIQVEGHKTEDCTVKPLQQQNVDKGCALPTCQICQKRGHIASECWQRTAATLLPGSLNVGQKMQKPQPTATGIEEPKTTEKAWHATACIVHNVVTTEHGQPEVKLACGSTLPVLQLCLDQAKVRQAGVTVCKGRIFEKNVSVIR